MSAHDRDIENICNDEYDHDLNLVASYMVSFFQSLAYHQGRRMRKSECRVARLCALKICKEYNHLALKHMELADKYNALVDKYNELKIKESK